MPSSGASEKCKGTRLFFVGGSNLFYGLDSQRVEHLMGRKVANMGLHAGLGFVYHYNAVKEYIKAGDIVCLVPEYGQFTEDTALGDMELLILAIDIMPEQQCLIPPWQWLHLVKFIPDYAPRKLRRKVEGLWNRKTANFAGFNEYGDKFPQWQGQPLNFPVSSMGGPEKINAGFLTFLQASVAEIESKGARALLLPPVLQRSTFEKGRNSVKTIEDRLQAVGIPYAMAVEDFVLDDQYFADTPYHLNSRGTTLRTDKIIECLRRVCAGCPKN